MPVDVGERSTSGHECNPDATSEQLHNLQDFRSFQAVFNSPIPRLCLIVRQNLLNFGHSTRGLFAVSRSGMGGKGVMQSS